MLHQDEWSMSTTPLEFPLLIVLLRNLLVHGMTSLLIVHVPPFIHSCITLSFEVQILNSLFQDTSYHPEAFQDILEHQGPHEPSRTKTNTPCPSAHLLDPSPIKVDLGYRNSNVFIASLNDGPTRCLLRISTSCLEPATKST